MKAKVDIYMPTYKPNAEYLREAIDSIFAQTEQDWTLYIQDEPTEVDTKEIVKEYLKDERVSFQQNKERLGIGKNWNACLQHGNAPYIQYMFQDDIWQSHFLESGIQVLDNHPKVGMVSLEHEYKIEESININAYKHVRNVQSKLKEGEKESVPTLLWLMHNGCRNFIGEPCFVMLRRAVVNEVGIFHESMKQQLDVEYWIRTIAISNWYFLPGNFGSFRAHNNGASAQNRYIKNAKWDRAINLYLAVQHLPSRKKLLGWILFVKATPILVLKSILAYVPIRRNPNESAQVSTTRTCDIRKQNAP